MPILRTISLVCDRLDLITEVENEYIHRTKKSRLRLKEAPTLQGGEELRQVFSFTGVSPALYSGTMIVTCSIARRYRRITGLGFGTHAHDVACDDVETV